MSLGKTIITTPENARSLQLEHGKNAYVITPSVANLTHTIEQIKHNRHSNTHIGTHALQTFITTHSIEALMQNKRASIQRFREVLQ